MFFPFFTPIPVCFNKRVGKKLLNSIEEQFRNVEVKEFSKDCLKEIKECLDKKDELEIKVSDRYSIAADFYSGRTIVYDRITNKKSSLYVNFIDIDEVIKFNDNVFLLKLSDFEHNNLSAVLIGFNENNSLSKPAEISISKSDKVNIIDLSDSEKLLKVEHVDDVSSVVKISEKGIKRYFDIEIFKHYRRLKKKDLKESNKIESIAVRGDIDNNSLEFLILYKGNCYKFKLDGLDVVNLDISYAMLVDEFLIREKNNIDFFYLVSFNNKGIVFKIIDDKLKYFKINSLVFDKLEDNIYDFEDKKVLLTEDSIIDLNNLEVVKKGSILKSSLDSSKAKNMIYFCTEDLELYGLERGKKKNVISLAGRINKEKSRKALKNEKRK